MNTFANCNICAHAHKQQSFYHVCNTVITCYQLY